MNSKIFVLNLLLFRTNAVSLRHRYIDGADTDVDNSLAMDIAKSFYLPNEEQLLEPAISTNGTHSMV